jgi:hypothetical protein
MYIPNIPPSGITRMAGRPAASSAMFPRQLSAPP